MWTFSSRRGGIERTSDLCLRWEVHGDPVSDDYTPEEASASELWSIWRRQYPGERLPIHWFVEGDGTLEGAPHSELGGSDFLTHYTWPVNAEGEALRWTDLRVVDKLWNPQSAAKGGFIQEYSGWKPSPFQQEMDVALLERVLKISASA